MPGDTIGYKAFLSYSHHDTSWGAWLHRAIERYRIAADLVGQVTAVGPVPQTLRPIFRDREDFSAGHSLTEQTLAALEASEFLIVVCSPNAARSAYVDEEIRRFKLLGRAERVLPIIVDGEPGDADHECFPPALRFRLGEDGAVTQEREEPIAADARAGKDGKALALQKTIAGLLGVPLDEVRKRDDIAWRRWATVGGLAGLSVAVLALVAGFFAWQHQVQRQDQARRDREFSQHMERQAQHTAAQNKLIEELTAHLGDGRGAPPAAPDAEAGVKRAVAAAVVGAAAGDPRYAEALQLLEAGKPKEAEPLFRAFAEEKERAAASREAAAAYRNLGAIAGLVDPKRALDAYLKAVELDGDDMDSRFRVGSIQKDRGDLDEAEGHFKAVLAKADHEQADGYRYRARLALGDIGVARGNLTGAMTSYREAGAIADRRAKAAPGNAGWQRDLSVSHDRIGDVLVAQGQLDAGLTAFRDGLAIRDRLAEADPGNAGAQRDLAVSHDKVGDVLVAQGQLDAALTAFRDGLAIRNRLAEADPGNAGWQRDLPVSHDRIGDVLVAQGQFDAALTAFRDGLVIRDRLAEADPGNAGAQRDLAVSQEKVGDVLVTQGKPDAALTAFRDGLAIRDRLAKADPGNAGAQRDLAVSHDKVGDVLVAQGKPDAALTAFRDGLAIRDRLAKADPGNAGAQRDLAVSQEKVGDVLVAQGQLDAALTAFRASLAIADRLAKADPGNADGQRDLALPYDKVGDVLVKQGQRDDALTAFRDSLAIRERLAKADPGNAGRQRDLSLSYDRIGGVLASQDKLDDALTLFRDSLAIRERLGGADSDHATWQRDLSISYSKIGALLMTQGQTTEALASYRADLAIAKRLAALDPGNHERRNDLALSHRQLADALQKIKNPSPEQRRWLRESRAQLATLEGNDASSNRRERSAAPSKRHPRPGLWWNRIFPKNR